MFVISIATIIVSYAALYWATGMWKRYANKTGDNTEDTNTYGFALSQLLGLSTLAHKQGSYRPAQPPFNFGGGTITQNTSISNTGGTGSAQPNSPGDTITGTPSPVNPVPMPTVTTKSQGGAA